MQYWIHALYYAVQVTPLHVYKAAHISACTRGFSCSMRGLFRVQWWPSCLMYSTNPGSKKYGAHLGSMWAELGCRVGTIWAVHMVPRWGNMGPRCPIWYPYSVCTVGPRWAPSGYIWGSSGFHVGCGMWGPYITQMDHLGTIWVRDKPSGTHVAFL